MIDTSVSPRAQRRGLMLLVGMIASVVTFAIGGGLAFAHHSVITAAADCSATVTYQAVSWQPGTSAGTNSSVKVWYTRSDKGSNQYDVTTGKFDASNNYRFSGTFAWPAPAGATITVYVQEAANWGDGAGPSAANNTAAISKPSDCTTAIATPVCVSGQNSASVAVTLTNTSAVLPDASYPSSVYSDQVNFTVTPSAGAPGGAKDYMVTAGSPQTITFTGVPSGAFTATIKVGPNQIDKSVSVNVKCNPATPAVTFNLTCVNNAGNVAASFTNTGDFDVTLAVTIDGKVPTSNASVLVPKNTTVAKVVNYSGLGQGPHTITVNNGQTTVGTSTFTVACSPANPVVAITPACANNAGNFAVSFTNSGDFDVTLAVTIDGNPAAANASVLVPKNTAAGSPLVINYGSLANGSHTIVVKNGGTTIGNNPFTFACNPANPMVAITPACANNKGNFAVSFTNSGDFDVTLAVTIDGNAPAANASVLVPKHTSVAQVVNYGALANGSHTIVVKNGGTTIGNNTFTFACNPASPAVTFNLACVNNAGNVAASFTNSGDFDVTLAVTIDGNAQAANASVLVPKNTSVAQVVNYGSLANGPHTVTVKNGQNTVGTTTVSVACQPGVASATIKAACSQFQGTVTVTLTYTGGDTAVDFVVDGTKYTLNKGDAPVNIVYANLADGTFTKAYTKGGVPQTPLSVTVSCAPKVAATAICNEVDANGVVTTHWFTLSNAESVPVAVTWTDGAATVPAKGSVSVKSSAAHLDVKYGNAVVASADQNESVCGKTVTVTKQIVGSPSSSEMYTVRVSRLAGASYVPVLTFNIAAGASNTFTLPSTLDPAGIAYKVEETAFGSASTHTVSPDSFTLSGNLGQGVSVVVTNGYASVSITKTVSAAQVTAGDQLVYTLVAKNTGGLTLNPVVISDLLPANVAFVSASVDGGGGTCEVANAAVRPQVLNCALSGSLAPGASTPSVDIRVVVDANTPADTTLLNQARVVGSYTGGSATSPAPEGALSCVPVVSGTVCNLSAQVSTLVQTQVANEPPVATPPVAQEPPLQMPPVADLPVTGSTGLGNMLTIGFVFVCLGGVVLLRRRRPGRTHS